MQQLRPSVDMMSNAAIARAKDPAAHKESAVRAGRDVRKVKSRRAPPSETKQSETKQGKKNE